MQEIPDQRDDMPSTVTLKAPCCGKFLRPAKLMLVATINVRRTCCGQSWSITIRPLKADPFRGFAVSQVDWTRVINNGRPATWDTEA